MKKIKENTKIKINIKVNNYKIENIGTKYKEILNCIDNNDNKTEVSFNLKKYILIRENKEIKIQMDFLNKKINYYLKENNKNLTIPITVKDVNEKENQIEITYQTEEEIFNLKIEYINI